MMKHKKKIITFIILVVLAITAWSYFKPKEGAATYVTAEIKKENLIQTVSETGMVKSAKQLELSFSQSGKLANIETFKGELVSAGQILAELDSQNLLYKKAEAAASLAISKKNLDKLLSGATDQSIAVSQANVNKAQSSYTSSLEDFENTKNLVEENIIQASKTLEDLLSDDKSNITPYEQAVINAELNLKNTKETYLLARNNQEDSLLAAITAKLAIANNSLDNIETIFNDSQTENLLSAKNPAFLTNAKNYVNQGKVLLVAANLSFETAKSSKTQKNIQSASSDSLAALNKTYQALSESYKVLENSVVSSSFTQAELDAYKATVSTQQVNVASAISTVQSAEQAYNNAFLQYDTKVAEYSNALTNATVNLADVINSARNNLSSAEINGQKQIAAAKSSIDATKSALDIAKRQIEELTAGARDEDVELSKAQIRQAEASMDLINRQIEDSVIISPISGTVIDVKYEPGEQVGVNMPVIIISSDNNLEIDVDISEADIAKVRLGNPAELTLDAFGESVKFMGKVFSIDPAETIIQDVIYYKTKISFNDDNPYMDQIKPGMTANIILTTAIKNNVLVSPTRAVIEKNGDRIIRILKNNEIIEKPAETGLKGDDGLIELISGAEVGDLVVTYINEK